VAIQVITQQAAGRYAVLPPPERFACLLDSQPGYLVPGRLRVPQQTAGRLIVNPDCWFARYGTPPAQIAAWAPLTENFYWGEEAVWVCDDVTGAFLPFSMGSQYRWLTAPFRSGEPVPEGLPLPALQVLAEARVLVAPEREPMRAHAWRRTLANDAALFRKGYAPVAGLLHPYHIGALRRYYRYRIRCGDFPLGDGQSPRRFNAHNESVARFFHRQLTPAIGAIAGRPVKPSYVYLASYQGGAELPKHTDRPQCEISVTLLVDCTPEPDIESPWPIHLETPAGVLTVYQAIGDSLLYRGRALPHYREMQPRGWTSTSLFLHYVYEDFDGSLD
jgi:hypothetical protein